MNRTKKILTVLAAIGVMCGTVYGFLTVFRGVLRHETPRTVSQPTETVYYAPPESETLPEPVLTLPTIPAETQPEPTQTEPPQTTVPETMAESAPETVPQTQPAEPDRKAYETVPNYYETDYPDIRFGMGFFNEYGSGVTSVAMVATYLTGYEYRPDQLAGWFSNYIGNQILISS